MIDTDDAAPTTAEPGPAGLLGLSLSAHPEATHVLIGLARELDASGKGAAVEAHRHSAHAARVSDGMVDGVEGPALRERAHELGTDRMSFAASMYAAGLDPAEVHMLHEKCRGIDPAGSVKQACRTTITRAHRSPT